MNRTDYLSEIDEAVIEGLPRYLWDDPEGQALLRIYRAGVLDSTTKARLMGRMQSYFRAQSLTGTPYELARLGHGDFPLGMSITDQPLFTSLRYRINGNAVTVGASGCGKSNKICCDAARIIPKMRGSWLVDFRKRGFRGLHRLLQHVGVRQEIIAAQEFKVNPLQVPLGVDPREYAPRIADMLIDVIELPARASKLIQVDLQTLYREYGVLDGSKNYPTLFDLRTAVATKKDANFPAKQAVVDSLDPILSSMGGVFAFRMGWSTHDLACRHLIFEFGGIAEVGKALLVNTLILSEFTSRVALGISNPDINLWICCDEALRLCAARQPGGGPGALADLIGIVRGTGISLETAVQGVAELSPHILSNSAIKILGRCGNAADYAVMGASMGLTSEQIQYCHFHLRPGLFVCQLGDGPWRFPFLLKVPSFEELMAEAQLGDKTVSNSADIIKADGVWTLPTVPALVAEIDTPKTSGDEKDAKASPSTVDYDESEIRFLKAVIQEPGLPSSEYVKIAAVGTRKARLVRERMIAAGYIRTLSVATGKRGRMALVLEPTAKAANDFAVLTRED